MAAKEKPVKVTPDLIIDLYLCSKKMPYLKQQKMLERCKFLSQNLYKYIVIK